MAGSIAGAIFMFAIVGLLVWRIIWTWTSDAGRAQERKRAKRKQHRKQTLISGGTWFGMVTPSERRHREMLAAIQQKETKP